MTSQSRLDTKTVKSTAFKLAVSEFVEKHKDDLSSKHVRLPPSSELRRQFVDEYPEYAAIDAVQFYQQTLSVKSPQIQRRIARQQHLQEWIEEYSTHNPYTSIKDEVKAFNEKYPSDYMTYSYYYNRTRYAIPHHA